MANLRASETLTVYPNIFKIRILIQIKLCENVGKQMDLSKKDSFSTQETTNYIPHAKKRKESTSMLNTWVIWVFALLSASKYVKETEDNKIKRQVYDSYIIKIEAVFSVYNDLLTLYCHKALHHRWCGGLRSLSGLLVFCAKHYQRDSNLTKPTFTCSKLKRRALEEGVKSVLSQQLRHKSNANFVVQVSLLSALNIVYISFCNRGQN